MNGDEAVIIWESIPKLLIGFDCPLNQLYNYLQKEYIRAGRTPMEATILLQELFNGEPRRLSREFGVVINDKEYLYRLGIGNLPLDIILGFYNQYCKELLNELKEIECGRCQNQKRIFKKKR